LVENDKLAEFLLHDVSKKIQEDAMIQTRMMAFSANDLIVQKIKKFYLSDYFDKYDVNVLLFNGNGEPLNTDIRFDSLWIRFDSSKYITEYENLFFVADLANNTKRYLQFSEITRQDVMVGKILIDMKLKKIIPNSVYPSLFIDKKFAAYNEDARYSYAIYRNNEQLYTFGDFSYIRDFLKYFDNAKNFAGKKTNDIKTKDEDNDKNYRHLLIKGEGKSVVVSSETYPFKSIVSNFSFLFIVLLLFNLVLAIMYSLSFRQINWNLNFSARIQIYINLAFFLPLVFVSILVVSILNSVNIEETRKNYIEKAENVSINLGASLENLRKGYINREKLLNPLVEVAKLTQTDINVFTKTGRLLVASQPFIYENSFLSELINPQALAKIIEQKQNKVMLTESIGSLEYNSVYVGVKSYETGEILGIIGIPFFESQRKSEQQIIEILSTIMNVFTFTFIFLLVMSYFASRILVKPLLMITQKIKRTTLGNNEPLEYKSEDEIGLLVGAYNQMLVKLEESKEALSRSEKESAWREMAKQVAHEIKNPLTPMKLSLQHLQRIFSLEKPQLLNSINSMIGQIDTLSDIATSFASFANMPIPKNEKFEMAEIVRQTVSLYENNENAIINLTIPAGEYFVIGDKKLMSRIITNLIINGIQAMQGEKTPQIDVNLQVLGKEKVIIEVKDNGSGISEDIRQKVFLPNFTTKHTGSGIGLALAKRGIEHAGGTIWFETEEGKGTSFFVEMPLMIVHKL
jgi:nitrogen fixation/metabolism regulation signal transduction histidine kinase